MNAAPLLALARVRRDEPAPDYVEAGLLDPPGFDQAVELRLLYFRALGPDVRPAIDRYTRHLAEYPCLDEGEIDARVVYRLAWMLAQREYQLDRIDSIHRAALAGRCSLESAVSRIGAELAFEPAGGGKAS